jgi:hypothetical protein
MGQVPEDAGSAKVRVDRPGMPVSMWKVADLSVFSTLTPAAAVDAINRRIQLGFKRGLGSPRQLSLMDESGVPDAGPWQTLPWPPRGFPSVEADFTFSPSGSGTLINVAVHLPNRYTLLIAAMIVVPAVLCVLSRSIVGVPVIAIGLIAYSLGRLQASTGPTAEIARLITV